MGTAWSRRECAAVRCFFCFGEGALALGAVSIEPIEAARIAEERRSVFISGKN